MNNKALLQDWQRTLRALSSVVDLFVAGDLVQPADGGLLDRLESAEVASRQAYHDYVRQSAPGAAASGQLPPGSARSDEQGLVRRKALPASGGETGSSVKPSVSSSSRSRRARRTTGRSGALSAGIGSFTDASVLFPTTGRSGALPAGIGPLTEASVLFPTTGQSGALSAGIGSLTDPQLVLPYVNRALAGVQDSRLQRQWRTVEGEVLAKQPQAKQSATTFRSQVLAAGAGTAIATPFGTELNKLVPLIDHLITLLAHWAH